MGSKDLSREELFESVKTLVETDQQHIHLNQQKLFTLFSIAFQYMLYTSTKDPGVYFLRIEDANLAHKLSRRAKDQTTRNFMARLNLPRKLTYQQSTFYLDYFHPGTWQQVQQMAQSPLKNKMKMALIVKDTKSRPLDQDLEMEIEHTLPEDAFYTTLREIVPQTVIVAYDYEVPHSHPISFPFIKVEEPRVMNGVRLAKDLKLDE